MKQKTDEEILNTTTFKANVIPDSQLGNMVKDAILLKGVSERAKFKKLVEDEIKKWNSYQKEHTRRWLENVRLKSGDDVVGRELHNTNVNRIHLLEELLKKIEEM